MALTGAALLSIAGTTAGLPYVFGAETALDNPAPRALDCSELTQWAAHRAGAYLPDGAQNQFNYIKGKGLQIPVERALRTPGALLFKYGTGRHAPIYHVGISTGDGKTVFEAKGAAYGVGRFDVGKWSASPAEGSNQWNLAGLVPGINYGTSPAGGSGAVYLALGGALAWGLL